MIKAVLFDVGGTILTTENNEKFRTDFAERLSKRLEDYGIFLNTPYEELGKMLHENAEEYKHRSEKTKEESPQLQIWSEYYLRDFEIPKEKLAPIVEELSFLYDYSRVKLMRRPGLNDCIEQLSQMGMRLGVISNVISTSFAPHILKEYGIDKYMECVLLSSETIVRKPDAAIFGIALDKMGLSPSEMCYVGDTISRDVLGSRNAGLGLCIQIKNPAIAHRDAAFTGADAPKPDYLIDELLEIPNIIKKENEKNNNNYSYMEKGLQP